MRPMNYTLGRGKVYFSRFKAGTQDPEGFLYVGNTPELSLTIESENLDHFSSDEGIREKDDSVPLEVTRTGAMTTDDINADNIAMFFFGSAAILSQAAVGATDYPLGPVKKGRFYQMGLTSTNPVGLRGLDTFILKNTATPTTVYVAGTDYNINLETGMLEILDGGAIANDTDVTANFAVKASTRDRVISGSEPVEGAMRFIAHNPKGKDFDYILPWVKVTPNGDYALKSDEWQQIPYSLEVLKRTDVEAIYCDGRPAYA